MFFNETEALLESDVRALKIKNNGGKIISIDRWGKKRLAFEIKRRQYGYYVEIVFEAPPNLIRILEREYRLEENILRYLSIHLNKKALDYREQQMQKKETVVEEEIDEELDFEPIEDELDEEIEEEISLPEEVESSPVIGDIDGDGYMEIIAVSWINPRVQILRYDGSILSEWYAGGFLSPTSPAFGDLDNDGDLELLVTTLDLSQPSKILAYDFEMNSVATPWSMLGNDEKHQNRYVINCQQDGTGTDGKCHEECGASSYCSEANPDEANTCCSGCYYTDVNGDGPCR